MEKQVISPQRENRGPDNLRRKLERLLIVDSASSVCSPGQQPKRSVNLVLLNREASAEFLVQFPNGEGDNKKKQAYAWENSSEYIGPARASMAHQRTHYFGGTNFPLGHVLTEKAAFDLGYVEPYIDTLCAEIAIVAERVIRDGRHYSENGGLTKALREAGSISADQSAALHGSNGNHLTLDIFAGEGSSWDSGNRPLGKSHPAQLYLFGPRDGHLITGCGYYLERTNTIYEFMNSVSAKFL